MMELINKAIAHNGFMQYVMLAMRIVTPFMVLFVVYRCYTNFKKGLRHYDPVIMLTDRISGENYPILFWENSIGRDRSNDIRLYRDEAVSRDHAVLLRRDEGWLISDLGSKSGTFLNDEKVEGRTLVGLGDVIRVGRTELVLEKSNVEPEKRRWTFRGFRKESTSPFLLMVMTMLVQISMTVQLMFGTGEIKIAPFASFIALFGISWVFYFFSMRIMHRTSFELETVGLLLSSIGILLLTGEDGPVKTQIAAMIIGVVLFTILISFLENSDRVTKMRLVLAGFAVFILIFNLIFGTNLYGARNWVFIGPFSFQPSEFVKIIFIIVGASTLDQLQTKKNITEFIAFGAVCMGCLFIMRDFGTACIFFAGFLVIAFMRSGSIRTVALILAVAVLGVIMIISFKPYVADRFSGWLHVWDHINDSLGYQQTRALTYIASGGMFGMGLGRGYLHFVSAGDSDLVFAMLSEEQGLLTSMIVIFAVAMLIMYTRAESSRSRSTFYSICASAAAGILVFQLCLNVFGTTDILPLTGVTLPFISAGGSSMMSCWGMLALIKASDERTYAAKRANHRERKEMKRQAKEEAIIEKQRIKEYHEYLESPYDENADLNSYDNYENAYDETYQDNDYYDEEYYDEYPSEDPIDVSMNYPYEDEPQRRDPGRRYRADEDYYRDDNGNLSFYDINDYKREKNSRNGGRRR